MLKAESHAKQPNLCPKCEKVLTSQIARGEFQAYQFCKHRRALGLVEGKNGKVTSWVLWGQMSRGKAHKMIIDLEQKISESREES